MPFENIAFKIESREAQSEINQYLSEKSREMRKIGIPVDENLRIQIDSYQQIYSQRELQQDAEFIKQKQEEFKKERKEKGDLVERYIVALLNKFLGERFFVLRTSEYDDFANGVDNLLIDKKTGKPFCAVDEVFAISEETLQRKREKVLSENFETEGKRGGAKIKYGISLERVGDRNFPRLAPLREVPVFYLPLSPEQLQKGLNSFRKEGKTLEEKEIFLFLLENLQAQIESLLQSQRISSSMRNSLEEFRKRLELVRREQNF